MKIFIFGSNGMLGNYVKSYLSTKYTIIPFTRDIYNFDHLNINTLDSLLIKNHLEENDIIINCAGIIPQSSNNKSSNNNKSLNNQEILKKKYYKINSLLPVILSMLCDKYNSKFIHITTDCVFSGNQGNYNELSEHDEINDYGTSKSLGELCNGTIIRTSIIGEEINHKYSLLEWVKSNANNKINGYINHYWNGVTCLQLAKIIYDIINNNLYWTGVRHIYSPRIISKYELVSIINIIYKLNIQINDFNTENIINKSITSIFDNQFKIPDIYQQIEELYNYNLVE
jgi:dTDP-4-dehydrorhamnose reductase